MTRNTYLQKIKAKGIMIALLICLLMCAVFGFVACKDEEETKITDPNYSYTEETTENTDLIKNANFKEGIDDTTSFPYASASDWTKAIDNSAESSSVSSGVIDTETDDKFNALLTNLKSDDDFVNYIKYLTDKETLEDSDYTDKFANPKTHDGATDNYVYMLNNIGTKVNSGLGTAQKITSSNTITLEKTKLYKVSVWVKTINIKAHGNYGANIRLTNSFNGTNQADFRISNINTNGEWKQYSIYVKPDETYTTKITVVLGLGYGDGKSIYTSYYVEGTAFFDDVTISEVAEIPNTLTEKTLGYGKTDKIDADDDLIDNAVIYNMNADLGLETKTFVNMGVTEAKLTESNVKNGNDEFITTKDFTDTSKVEESELEGVKTYTLTNASATVSFESISNVESQEYSFVSFKLQNKLDPFYNTKITVDVHDKYESNEVKRPAVATFSEVNEEDGWTTVNLMFKNNFTTVDEREYVVDLVIGATNVVNITNIDLANGTVSIKDFKIKSGSTKIDNYDEGADDPEYKIYSLLSSSANATVALYAGSISDYTEDNSKTTFDLNYSAGDIGVIENSPANVNGYFGVEHDSFYITNNDSASTKINNRENCGLINTDYIDNYDNSTLIKEQLTGLYDEDPLQLLMIYNSEASSYGYISASNTIAENDFASISVSLRVTGDAKAYVYIIDTSNENKSVMTFKDFKVNNDVIKGQNEKEINGNNYSMFFVVDKNTPTTDGFATVNAYIATGNEPKQFRVEVWNGSRDNADKSTGFVFVKTIDINSSSAFTEPTTWQEAFAVSGNPLFDETRSNLTELVAYTRELSQIEKKFNKDYPDQAVSYDASYVWAKGNTFIYAVFNSLEVASYDPYENITEEEEAGCALKTDASTFWLQFSSILLGVVLLLALIALAVKFFRRRRKANKSDAKTQYKVKSRISTHKENQKRAKKEQEESEEESTVVEDEVKEDVEEQPTEKEIEESEQSEEKEQDLDAYVYGDVQDFGDAETNEDKPEKEIEENEQSEEKPE